jgi:uncharacterized protein (DUF1778 family)
MGKYTSTQKSMTKVVIFNAHPADGELLNAAAHVAGISRSEFLRRALRKEARKILLERPIDDDEPESARTAS